MTILSQMWHVTVGKRKLLYDEPSSVSDILTDLSPHKESSDEDVQQNDAELKKPSAVIPLAHSACTVHDWQRRAEGFESSKRRRPTAMSAGIEPNLAALHREFHVLKDHQPAEKLAVKNVGAKKLQDKSCLRIMSEAVEQCNIDWLASEDELSDRVNSTPQSTGDSLLPDITVIESPLTSSHKSQCSQRTYMRYVDQASEGTISDCLSGDDESCSDVDEIRDPTACIDTIHNQMLSTTTTAAGTTTTTRLKASDWVESVKCHLTTPDKLLADDTDSTAATVDSSKKKRPKYIKNGLAEKLNKVIARERTAISHWVHKKSTSGSDRLVTFNVGQLLSDSGFGLALGAVCGNSAVAAGPASEDTASTAELTKNSKTVCVFSGSTVSKCNIAAGSTVNIHPPWMSLKLDLSTDVLLCTYFCESTVAQSATTRSTDINTIVFLWSCPCRSGGNISVASCPAQTNVNVCRFESLHKFASSDAVDSRTLALCKVDGNESLRRHRHPLPTSILDSIDERGGSVAVGVEFSAIVQRVFTKRLAAENGSSKRELQWSVLVQDIHGFLCEIVLPRDCSNRQPWNELLTMSPGQLCNFTGLRVASRLTRSRHLKLFSVIDTVWKPVVAGHHHSSADSKHSSQTQSVGPVLAPSFCYRVNSTLGESTCWPCTGVCTTAAAAAGGGGGGGDYSIIYTPPIFASNLRCAVDNVACAARVSFAAKVICHTIIANSSRLFYVTDLSLLRDDRNAFINYLTITVADEAYISETVLHSLSTCRVAFHDVLNREGMFCVDEYSRLEVEKLLDAEQVVNVTVEMLPTVTLTSVVHSLVTVTGCIVGIDESTAFSWSACSVCNNAELTASTSNSDSMFCATCNADITDVVTRMTLAVYVITTADNLLLRVNLCQNTIEALLAEPAGCSQGYDVQDILGSCVGPLSCVLCAVHSVSNAAHCVLNVSCDSVNFELQEVVLI